MARSKGQGATEYLVILGAVLLVAMVIIALLGWFPQVGGPSREKESESYWSTATPFSITTVRLTNGTALLVLANRGSDKLNVTEIQFDDGAGVVRNLSTGYNVFTAGEEKAIYVPNFVNGNPCTYTATGRAFEITQVTIMYNFMTYSMRQSGARPLVSTCA